MLTRVARAAGRALLLIAVVYAVLVGVGLLLTKVVEHSWLIREEDELNDSLADGRTPLMDDVTYLLSGLGNTVAIVAAMVLVAICLRLAMKRWAEPLFLIFAVSAQALLFLLTTLVISRRRPMVAKLDESPPTSSFPSGHTGAATALFIASAFLVAWYVRRRLVKVLAVAVLVAVPLLVAYARLYRGMHHPTDVLVAHLNGLACVGIASVTLLGRRLWGDRRTDPAWASRPGEDGAPKKRAAVVYNPTRVADLPAMRARVETAMRRAGWTEPLWLATTVDDPGIGMCEVAVRDECDVVFVCGGDGTVMAAVTALAGGDVPMAIIPTGTGNLLARNLGVPLDDEAAALRIGMSGHDRRIDVASVGDRRFAVMAGLGFDAATLRDTPEGLKRAVGWPAYAVSASKNLRGRGIRVRITLDGGEPIHRRVRTVVVGNVGKLQGGISLLPDARDDDGILDVVVIAPRHVADWVRVTARVIRRADVPDRRIERFRAQHVVVEASRPQPRQLDGDLISDGTTLDVRVEPAALRVRVP